MAAVGFMQLAKTPVILRK